MTEREAIRILKGIEDDIGYGSFKMQSLPRVTFNAFQMAIDALERQIPKKIVFKPTIAGRSGGYYYCPICHDEIGFEDYDESKPFCANCGQALDWSEVEE